MKNALYILISLILLNNAQAGLGGSCSTFLSKLVSIIGISTYKAPKLGPEASAELHEFVKERFSELKKVSFNDIHYKEGEYLLSILPNSTIEHLKKYPSERNEVIEFKKDFRTSFNIGSDSIFNNIFSILASIKRRGGNIEVEIDRALESFEKRPAEVKEQLELEFKKGQYSKKATDYMNKLGKYPIRYEYSGTSFNGNIQVHIGLNSYSGKITKRRGKDVIIMEVPIGKVKHPAWNPLDHQYIATLASDPFRIPKKDFDVVVGHDGNFYLMDGNHRFTLHSGETVKVVINMPATTVSFKNYLDLINVPQPKMSEVIEIYQKELNPYDLIPSYLRSHLLPEFTQ